MENMSCTQEFAASRSWSSSNWAKKGFISKWSSGSWMQRTAQLTTKNTAVTTHVYFAENNVISDSHWCICIELKFIITVICRSDGSPGSSCTVFINFYAVACFVNGFVAALPVCGTGGLFLIIFIFEEPVRSLVLRLEVQVVTCTVIRTDFEPVFCFYGLRYCALSPHAVKKEPQAFADQLSVLRLLMFGSLGG